MDGKSSRRYAEVFPVKYEQFTGFGLVEKVKERVVLTYSFAEDARSTTSPRDGKP